jgi:hypothetical protein
MNAEGSFTTVTGPLLIKNAPDKVIAQDVASFTVSADATNTLFVALTSFCRETLYFCWDMRVPQ